MTIFKAKYYLLNILAPTLLIMLVALGVFWLPANCGEKISLSITVLLAFSVTQIVILDITPVNSKQTPLMGAYSHVHLLYSLISCKMTG